MSGTEQSKGSTSSGNLRSFPLFRAFHQRTRVEDENEVSKSEERSFVQKVERKRLFIIVLLAFAGWFCILLSIALPELFLFQPPGSIAEAHVGYFFRCFYLNDTKVSCQNEIIFEIAAPLAMNFFSLLLSFGVILFGTRRLVSLNLHSSEDELSDTFKRLRLLSLLSGISATCGIATFTYLYNAFVVPIFPSFALGWIAAILLMTGGTIGYCFKNPSRMTEVPEPGREMSSSSQGRTSLHGKGTITAEDV